MDRDEFEAALEVLARYELGTTWIASVLRMNERMAARWRQGKRPMPDHIAVWLRAFVAVLKTAPLPPE